MNKLFVDFETKSEFDIADGLMKYANGKYADILMLGHKANNLKTGVWQPGYALPDEIKYANDFSVYAFNAQFDVYWWNRHGTVRYGFPRLKYTKVVDVMALAGRYTYPQGLAKVGDILGLEQQKHAYGKQLIKMFCCPPFVKPEDAPEDWQNFRIYCARDVDAMVEMVSEFPSDKLSIEEQKNWVLNAKINRTGLPIDIKEVNQILDVCSAYQIEQAQRLPDLTDGIVTTIGQVQKIKTFANTRGVPIKNTQAATIEKCLLDPNLPPDVRELFVMRQELGKSSTAKYKRLKQYEYNNRIYDNLRYYGTSTGRDSGLGFQMLNLPRASAKDPESVITSFMDYSVLGNDPIVRAKELIRAMIKAGKGKKIAMIDYSSIEYILLMWVCDELEAMESFSKGQCQYKEMAAWVYGKAYEDITDEERFVGKVIILGCGYGLGHEGFFGYAESWGLNLTPSQCLECVNSFRERYESVPKLWYKSKDAMITAIENPGYTIKYQKSSYKKVIDRNKRPWMQLTLPSGRALYYSDPQIMEDKYGPVPTHLGMNPYSKKWTRLKLIPGRIAENIVQASARDILRNSLNLLNDHGFSIIGSVYDEAVLEVDEDQDFNVIKDLMQIPPGWCSDLPLRAEGEIGPRYKKM
jgi:DNA polymerase